MHCSGVQQANPTLGSCRLTPSHAAFAPNPETTQEALRSQEFDHAGSTNSFGDEQLEVRMGWWVMVELEHGGRPHRARPCKKDLHQPSRHPTPT
jgi:hypothetical protein